MSGHDVNELEELIRRARDGVEGALGSLLDHYRTYLLLLARLQISRRLQSKASGSDLAQETLLEAHRCFSDFRGGTEPELLAWLRQILCSRLSMLLRHFSTERRAVADYTEAVRLDPRDFTAYAWRGYMHSRKGDFDQAIADYTTSIRVDINLRNGSVYAWRGLSYLSKGDIERAMADYNKAIELVPDYTFTYCCRAFARLQLGHVDDALRDLSRTDELHPRDFLDLHVVSWFLATCPDPRLRRPERVVELAEEVVKLMPNTGFVLMAIGIARYRAGDLKAALAALEKSTQLRSRFFLQPASWFFLAMVHQKLGHEKKAHTSYDEAVRQMVGECANDEELRQFQMEAAQLLRLARTTEFR